MQKHYHIKGKQVHRFVSTNISLDNLQAFSIELKPNSEIQYRGHTPNNSQLQSHSHNHNIDRTSFYPASA